MESPSLHQLLLCDHHLRPLINGRPRPQLSALSTPTLPPLAAWQEACHVHALRGRRTTCRRIVVLGAKLEEIALLVRGGLLRGCGLRVAVLGGAVVVEADLLEALLGGGRLALEAALADSGAREAREAGRVEALAGLVCDDDRGLCADVLGMLEEKRTPRWAR